MIVTPLKVVVLEAAGKTGREFVRIALGDAMEVTAIIDDPAQATGLEGTRVVVDPRSVGELADAFEGADVVVSCMTPSERGDTEKLKRSMTAVVHAMRTANVSRLVAVSDSGPYTKGDDLLTKYLVKPTLWMFMAKPFADIRAMESVVRSSGTRWAILRPPQVTDRQPKGKWETRDDGNVQWGFRITRGDLAKAIYDQVVDRSPTRKTLSVSNSSRANAWPARPNRPF